MWCSYVSDVYDKLTREPKDSANRQIQSSVSRAVADKVTDVLWYGVNLYEYVIDDEMRSYLGYYDVA